MPEKTLFYFVVLTYGLKTTFNVCLEKNSENNPQPFNFIVNN